MTDQILRIATAMALGKGAINRFEPEERLVGLVATFRDVHPAADVAALEAWLGTLTDAQVDSLADDEQAEVDALLDQLGERSVAGCVLLDDLWEAL